jgi:membrane associated rhomboid family serine protease
MTPTTVGMRCPECAKQRTRVVKMRGLSNLPRVTYALIAINVVAFFSEEGQFTIAGTSIHGPVIQNGVLWRFYVSTDHQYWRLISGAFLHEDLLHIGFNMYLLYLLGMMLEPAIGSLRFSVIYFTALLTGSFGALFATANPSLGASGAIFGLMGAAAVELRARGISVMQSGIGVLIIFNLVLSFSLANISVGAHVGGLIGGALAALAIREADRRRSFALGLAACIALCVASVLGSIVLPGSSTGIA